MNCVITINGREAIPVRAIPFITGRKAFSPDAVAMGLAQRCDWGRLQGLTAYHLDEDGGIHEMRPKEWDSVVSEMSALSELLKKDDPEAKASYPEWYKKSILCLPSHCFVLRDEFERVYKRAMDRLYIANERDGDRQLNYNPRIPAAVIYEVFDGLPRSSLPVITAVKTECFKSPVSTGDSIQPQLAHKHEQSQVSDTEICTARSVVEQQIAESISRLPEIPRLLRRFPEAAKIYSEHGQRVKQDAVIKVLTERLDISKHEAKAIDMHFRQDNQRFRNCKHQGKKANKRAGCSAR